MNQATPAEMSPPRKLPVVLMMAPMAWVPTKPPRFPKELTKAIPAAAEYPVKNSLGNDQKGPMRPLIADAVRDQSAIVRKTELVVVVLNITSDNAPIVNGIAPW